ncbi:MAG TPA: hypothetical protein VLQ65_01705 [Saliniramus sp.]|nr:hypothetical protein [Saliniramus sp.]
MGDHDEELLALRILNDPLDRSEFLTLIVVDVTAFDVCDSHVLLLRRADGARRLRLLADAEELAAVTLSLRLLCGLLLSLLLTLLLLAFRHALDANARLSGFLLELDLRLAGTLERHLRLGLLGADHGLRLIRRHPRLRLLDLNLRLGLSYGDLRLGHTHDDFGLRLLHDDGRRSLTDDDLRRLLLNADLRGLLIDRDQSSGRIALSLLLTSLSLHLTANLNRLLGFDLGILGLLLLVERLRALDHAVLADTLRDELLALHVHALERKEHAALVLLHLDEEEGLLTLALDDACNATDRLALLAHHFTVHQIADGHFLQLTLLSRLALLHLLLLRLTLRLGLLCTRRHGNHRRGTEERCK